MSIYESEDNRTYFADMRTRYARERELIALGLMPDEAAAIAEREVAWCRSARCARINVATDAKD